ncbi:alpha-mannosidase [Paenibacillus sp. KQZ6P-2]|uniref:Alpha-mannosidase n=1 Tax=Paenibacillus mangrovi TaxID=2931978 RepID=A0A9X2B5H2_9BACL|nr:alpha-mannosidase [Paenibacillus mangrovi]MCJ8012033.1 alpha-mannosidase [Paenibacillus mangrovi]
MRFVLQKLENRIRELAGIRYREGRGLDAVHIVPDVKDLDEARRQSASGPLVRVGDHWGGRDRYAWFMADIEFPQSWKGQDVIGLIKLGETGGGNCTGYEAQVFLNGEPLQALDRNHAELFFPEDAVASGRAELAIYAWSGLTAPDGRSPFDHRIDSLSVAILDEDVDDLYYTSLHMLQTVKQLDERQLEKHELTDALEAAFRQLDWSRPGSEAFYASAVQARHTLRERLEAIPRGPRPQITAVGHCHIDVAWLWRLQHTREKSGRSFSTVLTLMDRFPEYVFLQSQPQLYAYLKKDFPTLYAKIKDRVQSGNWEATGAMWLESDCNIPSGESLVRQLLTGKRFFRDEFGVDNRVLWLPDVFGYSWALPQILKKSGIDYFMTTKISWSQYNRFPYDTFTWRGIDGTEILTHYITTPDNDGSWFYTYNGNVTGASVQGLWNNYRQKDINDQLLLAYGWGDGGGGPTRDMLEAVRRYEDMPGAPQVKAGGAEDFFGRLEEQVKDQPQLHLWDGELYLEYHRGTYTSQAYNKRMNRRMELLLHNAEFLNAFALALNSEHAYPSEQLAESWEIVLRNQFHDIIPGSSIHEVYEDSKLEYEESEKLALAAIEKGLGGLNGTIGGESAGAVEKGVPVRIFNALGWTRSFLAEVEIDGAAEFAWYTAEGMKLDVQADSAGSTDSGKVLVAVQGVPAYGYTTIYGRREAERMQDGSTSADVQHNVENASESWSIQTDRLETPYYSIRLNEAGQIASLYDKQAGREVLKPGQPANVLQVFEDKPMAHDAWDIDIYYQDKMTIVDGLQELTVLEAGPLRGVLKLVFSYQQSTIEQHLIVYRNHPRIDFKTRVDWNEHQQLLKTAFPVEIRSTKATYEIQFGNVERPTHWNTSWDYARFESVAQRWVDLSEGGYGVSLLNDCKYGHDIRNHVIRLSLIKSAVYPDGNADQGLHEFTYSLYPHSGGWYEAGTHQAACELNAPLMAAAVPGSSGLPTELGMLKVDAHNVMIDTVKKSEDGNTLIVRLYEFGGIRTKAAVTVDPYLGPVRSAEETDLMEEHPSALPVAGQDIEVALAPYEIKTLNIVLS